MELEGRGGIGTVLPYTDFVEKSKRNEVRSGVEYYLFEIMEPSCLMEPSWIDCVCSCLALAFSSVTHSHLVGGNTAYVGNTGASSTTYFLHPPALVVMEVLILDHRTALYQLDRCVVPKRMSVLP